MTNLFASGDVRPEQGPPLSIPITFFFIASLAIGVAGALLAIGGAKAVANRYLPTAQMVTHLGTLGFLGAIMLGALYQMVPVVAGQAVRWPRLAYGVAVGLVVGLSLLLVSFQTGAAWASGGAALLLGLALLAFVFQVGEALVRAPTRSRPVWGMRIAVGALWAVLGLALSLVLMRMGWVSTALWSVAWPLHVLLGLFVWVGGLVVSVSWQIIPMFYASPRSPAWVERLGLVVLAHALAAPVVAAFSREGWGREHLVLWFVPVAFFVLLIQPLVWAWQLMRRGRRRKDASMLYWASASCLGPIVLLSAWTTWRSGDPRWATLFGWLFLFGWVGLIAHGMLTRIVPFLVWFHRWSHLVGVQSHVPAMRQLWPESWVRVGLVLHGCTVVLGVGAWISTNHRLGQLTGLGLIALSALILRGLVCTFRVGAGPLSGAKGPTWVFRR
ncbi:MAG: hypothetical protein IPK13_01680 [Deltaproteobacteria bacterium]|nr:hypothetical protein [Deltaproteobacteria bacterium]